MVVAVARRTFRRGDPLPRIRALHFFLPVIEELLEVPCGPDYVQYLKNKLEAHVSQEIQLHRGRAAQPDSTCRIGRGSPPLLHEARSSRGTAATLIALANATIARHHSSAYDAAVRAFCTDLDSLRQGLKAVNREIAKALEGHALAQILTSIEGLGSLTVARLLACLGDPALFRSAAALASYVGVVPATNQSGLSRPNRAPVSQYGNARLRAHLWMPTLVAIKRNPWLRAYYQRLVARGKPRKLAVVAAMRRLLTAIYSVAKSRRPFIPRVDQAAVAGNAATETKAH